MTGIRPFGCSRPSDLVGSGTSPSRFRSRRVIPHNARASSYISLSHGRIARCLYPRMPVSRVVARYVGGVGAAFLALYIYIYINPFMRSSLVVTMSVSIPPPLARCSYGPRSQSGLNSLQDGGAFHNEKYPWMCKCIKYSEGGRGNSNLLCLDVSLMRSSSAVCIFIIIVAVRGLVIPWWSL